MMVKLEWNHSNIRSWGEKKLEFSLAPTMCVCSLDNCHTLDRPHSQMGCCEASHAGIQLIMMMFEVAWDHSKMWSWVEQNAKCTLAVK